MKYEKSDKEYCINYCREHANKPLTQLSYELAVPYTTLGLWCKKYDIFTGQGQFERAHTETNIPKKDWIKHVLDNPCKPISECARDIGITRSGLVAHLTKNGINLSHSRGNVITNIPKSEWIDYVRSHPDKTKKDCAIDIGITPSALYYHLKKYAINLVTVG